MTRWDNRHAESRKHENRYGYNTESMFDSNGGYAPVKKDFKR